MNKLLIILQVIFIQGCSNIYTRLTLDFNVDIEDTRINYESGAENLTKLVKENLNESIKIIESEEFIPIKEPNLISLYIFNDKDHYSGYSFTSNKTRGSASTNEIYLSPILNERINSLSRILKHELSHIHLRQYIGTWSYTLNIPSWYHEGLAVVTSDGGGAERVSDEEAIKEINNGRHFKLSDSGSFFGHKSASDFNLKPHMYYRQASLFIRFLQRKDIQAFKNSYIGLTNGEDFKEIWYKHYNESLSSLWSKFLTEVQA